MKKDTIYAHPNFGCLIYVIDITKGVIIFSSASFLNDLFTTILHYEVAEKGFKEQQFVELSKDNYELHTCYKHLGTSLEIKAEGSGQYYKYATDWHLKHAEKIDIGNKVNNFKDWKYENK